MGRTPAAATGKTSGNSTKKRKQPAGVSESSNSKGQNTKNQKRKAPAKKKAREFWLKTYTKQGGMIVMFSEEALGPFKTKEEAVEAIEKEVEKIESNHDIDIPEEDYLGDCRETPPNNGRILAIKNESEKYCFDISTKKPKIFDGADSDGPF